MDIDELITRSLQGRSTAAEEERLQRLRSHHPETERRYQTLQRIWLITESVDSGADAGRIPAAGVLVAAAERPREHRRSRFVVAALAAAIAGFGVALGVLVHTADQPNGLLDQTVITTGSGEMTTLDLADGTSIRVGPRSQLRLGHEGSDRVAWLEEGRAYFGVQSHPLRTFTVRSALGEAVVLGTRFEVRSEADEFRVLVVDGSLEVFAGGQVVNLSEGEMSTSSAGGPPLMSKVDDVYAHLDWMGNSLVFQATPLRKAVREIEHRYGLDVILGSPELENLEVTVTFTGQRVEDILTVLCEIVGAQCAADIDGGTVEMNLPPQQRRPGAIPL